MRRWRAARSCKVRQRDRALRARSSASIATTARSRASIATACWRGRPPNCVAVIDASQRLGEHRAAAPSTSRCSRCGASTRRISGRAAQIAPDIAARAARCRARAGRLPPHRRPARRASRLAPGMAITLNGIAQGYITDRDRGLGAQRGLRARGGRSRRIARARQPSGRPPVARPRHAAARHRARRQGARGSSGAGTTFEPSGRFHHIFDPATGASANALREVAVIAPRAMIADALATAICVVGEERAASLLAAYPGAQALRHAGHRNGTSRSCR